MFPRRPALHSDSPAPCSRDCAPSSISRGGHFPQGESRSCRQPRLYPSGMGGTSGRDSWSQAKGAPPPPWGCSAGWAGPEARLRRSSPRIARPVRFMLSAEISRSTGAPSRTGVHHSSSTAPTFPRQGASPAAIGRDRQPTSERPADSGLDFGHLLEITLTATGRYLFRRTRDAGVCRARIQVGLRWRGGRLRPSAVTYRDRDWGRPPSPENWMCSSRRPLSPGRTLTRIPRRCSARGDDLPRSS